MYRNLLITVCLQIVFTVITCMPMHAQYVPGTAQSFQQMPLYNPSFTGIEPFGDLKFSYRYQWSGFGTYSPKFIHLGLSTRLVKPLELAHNSPRISQPSALRAENIPRAKRMIHGLGGTVFHSKVGAFESIGGGVSYAVHYPLRGSSHLAVGAAMLIENRKLDVSEVSVRDPDTYYDQLLNGSTSQTEMNVRAGALLYGEHYYIGVTYFPLLYDPVGTSELSAAEQFYRTSFQVGVAFQLGGNVALKPSVLALILTDDVVIDYHIKAYFRQNIWMGVSYRDVESGIALVGWNFNDALSASYSYEMSLGPLKQFNDGSHELVLSFRLGNFRKYSQYTW